MTGEEVEKAITAMLQHEAKVNSSIEFILDQQTKLVDQQIKTSNKVEFLVEQHAKIEIGHQQLQEDIKALTGIVTGMALQADADRTEMRNVGSELRSFATEMRADREAANSRMDKFAASVTDAMRQMAEAQTNTSARLTKLEEK